MLSEKRYYLLAFYSVFISYCALATLNVIFKIPGFNYLVVAYFLIVCFVGLCSFSRISPVNIILFYFVLIVGGVNYFLAIIDVGALYPFFYLLLVLLTYFFITKAKINSNELYKMVVRFFYIYLLISIVTFNLFSSIYRHFTFEGVFLERAFHGIEGSPANIDTFASLFIIIVLSHLKVITLKSFFHITVFLLTIYFCDTQTPLLIGLSIVVYKIGYFFFGNIVNRLTILSMYSVMIVIFYLSINSEEFYNLLIIVTNGRNYIWNEQISNITSSFSWMNLFYGDFTNAFVAIHWSAEDTNNPHNGFLFILLRFGLLFTFFLFSYLYYAAKKANNLKILLLIALLAASVSNSNVFYLSNPLITFLLIYSVTNRKEEVIYEESCNLLRSRRA